MGVGGAGGNGHPQWYSHPPKMSNSEILKKMGALQTYRKARWGKMSMGWMPVICPLSCQAPFKLEGEGSTYTASTEEL